MGIQKNAEEILVFIYKEKIAGNSMPHFSDILKLTNWSNDELTFALEYLIRKNFIDGRIAKGMGSTKTRFISINDITPIGIDVIEDEAKTKHHFSHTINLGLYKFSWSHHKETK